MNVSGVKPRHFFKGCQYHGIMKTNQKNDRSSFFVRFQKPKKRSIVSLDSLHHNNNMVLQSAPVLQRSPSLKDAEDSRLMARIERNFECLRRDGRAAGTLSGWGDLLLKKFRNTEAEKSEMAPSQSAILSAWLNGIILIIVSLLS
jgi:hypothetical protein